MSSYRQDVSYVCGACEHHGMRPTWLVVDAADRPDVLEDVVAGRMQTFACDNCEAPITRTTSLLVLSGRASQPLFAADPGADARLTQEQLMVSLSAAFRDQQVDRYPGVLPIPHDLLPVAAGRDVDDDLEASRAGTFSAGTVELQRYGDWLAEIGPARFHARVKEAVTELTGAGDAAAFAAVVRRRPELLSDEADALLGALQDVTVDEGQPEMERRVEQWRFLLRRCREQGVEQTVAQLRDE
jgi:CpXC protein